MSGGVCLKAATFTDSLNGVWLQNGAAGQQAGVNMHKAQSETGFCSSSISNNLYLKRKKNNNPILKKSGEKALIGCMRINKVLHLNRGEEIFLWKVQWGR